MPTIGIFTRALVAAALVGACGLAATVHAQEVGPPAAAPDFKPFAEVSKGFEKVVSTADGKSYYTLWTREKDGAMLAELPRGWETQKQFIALTTPTGEDYSGLQAGSIYCYWRRIDNRLALIQPNLGTRSTGDVESKTAIKEIFTDRVILDLPIVTMGPAGQPVIDMKDLLVGKAGTFYGGAFNGANPRLATIKRARAYPENIEVSYEMPTAGGRLQEFHYSISLIPDSTGYTPRQADERVGYFTTVYRDLGKFSDSDKWVRSINRWHLEKRDPKLKMSPPKQPIVWYVDSAVPVRYRTAVRDGILSWNKAFEKVGIVGAIEVYQQDEASGAHMEKSSEDVRYNFVRWLANDQGTAIGPTRVHPLTGQILDADVILTDGWIRHFWVQFNEVMPELAMEGMSAETLAWLDTRPQWDPRVRLADPAQRDSMIADRMRRGVLAYGGHPIAANANASNPAAVDANFMVTGSEYDGLVGRGSQVAGMCNAARGKALDMAMMRMSLELMDMDEVEAAYTGAEPTVDGEATAGKDGKDKDEKKKDEDKKAEKKYDVLDGIPDWFIGPLLADLTAHEVGHCLGLRHNFKASSQFTLAEINSDKVKGKKAFTASVMDYTPVNFSVKDGKAQGDFAMIDVGAYDYWAIEYGYTLEDPKKVVSRVAEAGLDYGTDEDTGGPDPLARRYDFSKNPLDYAKSRIGLATYHRGRLLDKFVKDGESWAKVRRGYEATLGMQVGSLSMMSGWVGGAFVHRDRKGDPDGRPPIEVVPAESQREALQFIIDNSFLDESFGLTPELLAKMTVDKWMDVGGYRDAVQEPAWPIHDRIAGIQSSVLTMLMNPTTLRRVFDNEFRVASDQDALTLPEVLDTISASVWSELEEGKGSGKAKGSDREGPFTARKPMVSSLRRNLQREYVERMIDLTLPGAGSGEAYKPVSNLVIFKLRTLKDRLAEIVDGKDASEKLDPYTLAHLTEAKVRIEKALDAGYVYNAGSMGGGMPFFMMFGQQPLPAPAPTQIRGE